MRDDLRTRRQDHRLTASALIDSRHPTREIACPCGVFSAGSTECRRDRTPQRCQPIWQYQTSEPAPEPLELIPQILNFTPQALQFITKTVDPPRNCTCCQPIPESCELVPDILDPAEDGAEDRTPIYTQCIKDGDDRAIAAGIQKSGLVIKVRLTICTATRSTRTAASPVR